MKWLALLQGLVALARALVGWLDRRQAIKAGEARAIARTLEVTHVRIQMALAARRHVDHHRLPDDDPYRRD